MESIITNGTSVLGAVERGASPGVFTRGMLAARGAPARDARVPASVAGDRSVSLSLLSISIERLWASHRSAKAVASSAANRAATKAARDNPLCFYLGIPASHEGRFLHRGSRGRRFVGGNAFRNGRQRSLLQPSGFPATIPPVQLQSLRKTAESRPPDAAL